MQAASGLVGKEIVVPGSIANMGPGFDTLAIAVRIYLRLKITRVDPARTGLQFHFTDKAPDGENYIERAFRHLADSLAPTGISGNGHALPFLEVEASSDIPMKGGLGSSAAATVAGLRLFEVVYGAVSQGELLAAATVLEGHPDNAAAALLGGLTVCCQRSDGSVAATSCPWPEAWEFLVLTPELGLATKKSRGVLPSTLSMADAVANLQRVGMIVAAAHSGDESLLAGVFDDRLHQPYRQELVPGLAEILKLRHTHILGAFLSGSGPSIAVVVRGDGKEAQELLNEAYLPLGIPFQVRRLRVYSHQG